MIIGLGFKTTTTKTKYNGKMNRASHIQTVWSSIENIFDIEYKKNLYLTTLNKIS